MEKLKNYVIQANRQYAFIDETGNYGFDFDKSGVSSHFIITAIIVDEDYISKLEMEVEKIRKIFFNNGEMKSSSIGKNHPRRKKILENISNLNFHHYSIVVNKHKIFTDSGLMYKKPFFKYLNNKLHNELAITFPKLQMVSDAHGSKDFMKEFTKYVDSKHQPSLFEEYDFGFDNSKSNVLIQLADIIAGTISFNYEDSKDKSLYNDYKEVIETKRIGLVEWPVSYDNYIHEYQKFNTDNFDNTIYVNSFRLAIDYINKHELSKDQIIVERVYVLKYLLTSIESGGDSRYVSSKELINNLSRITRKEHSKHYFKTKIIAKLRDEGILISSSNRGYKIPESEKDIYSFINHSNSMIEPMLSRVKKARNRIFAATKGELDILNKDGYENLKRYIDG